jgi:hypothetical protein
MRRLRGLLVALLVTAFALSFTTSAFADIVTDTYVDLESGRLPDGWSLQADSASADAAIVGRPQPVYRGEKSLRLRVLPTMSGPTGSWLVCSLPADAYKVQLDGFVRIESVSAWGAADARLLLHMPGARGFSGLQVSPTVGTMLGYYGAATGPSTWQRYPDRSVPLASWQPIKVVYDARTRTEELYVGNALLFRGTVDQAQAPDSVRVGAFAGPSPGSFVTAYFDNVHMTLWRAGDTSPPSTTAEVAGTEGKNGWYRSAVAVALRATDVGSGVAKTEYSLDGGKAWKAYAEPIVVDAQGPTALLYRSSDKTGNAEQVRTLLVKVDSEVPEVAIASPCDCLTVPIGATVEASWNAADAVSGLDAVAASAPSGALLDTSQPGKHEFKVEASDIAGNATTSVVSYIVAYDKDLSRLPKSKTYCRNRTLPIRFWLYGAEGVRVRDAKVLLTVAPADAKGEVTGPRVSAPARPFRVTKYGTYKTLLRLKKLGRGYHRVFLEFDDGTETSFLVKLR